MGVRLLNLAAVASLPAVLHLACSISPLPLPLPSRSLPQYQTTAPAVQIVAAVPDEQRLDVVERAAAARRRRRALAHLHDGRPLVRVGLGSAVAVTEAVVGDELDDVRLLRLRLERLAATSVAGRRDSPGLHGPRTCRSSASGGPSGGSGTRARVAYGAAEQRRRATARASRRRRWPVVSSGKSSCEHASGREEDGAGLGALVVLVAVVGAAENNGDKLGLELATMAPTRSSREGEGAKVAGGKRAPEGEE
ncbi:unnamed protein product [Miscanthus lutarioriparius]|uniref:Uncharacterized protein n=1 Tax=Miscanthus lutarioriparius TaxID=422564 RepID=A0A811MQB3_9POAL|nr:unnamed protein product [Miscanthus lutarioriparius]